MALAAPSLGVTVKECKECPQPLTCEDINTCIEPPPPLSCDEVEGCLENKPTPITIQCLNPEEVFVAISRSRKIVNPGGPRVRGKRFDICRQADLIFEGERATRKSLKTACSFNKIRQQEVAELRAKQLNYIRCLFLGDFTSPE